MVGQLIFSIKTGYTRESVLACYSYAPYLEYSGRRHLDREFHDLVILIPGVTKSKSYLKH